LHFIDEVAQKQLKEMENTLIQKVNALLQETPGKSSSNPVSKQLALQMRVVRKWKGMHERFSERPMYLLTNPCRVYRKAKGTSKLAIRS
jgi:hypothetical protein